MPYYKYVATPAALKSILADEMKFTVPVELNDPSELFPKFSRSEVLSSLNDLRVRGHTDAEFEGLERQHALMRALVPHYWKADLPLSKADADRMIRLPIFDNVALVEQLFHGMLESMSASVAVACLSKRWDCLPMWAHYANRARGMVIGYENLDGVFPGDDTGWLNCLKEVTYSREFAGISFYPDSYGAIFFSKLRDWAYEAEVRIATELSRCTRTTHDSATTYTRAVPVACVTAVILGWRMPEDERKEVLAALSNPNFRFIKVRIANVIKGELTLRATDVPVID